MDGLAAFQSELDRIEAVMQEHPGQVPCVCGAGQDGAHLEYCPAHPDRASECYRGEWPIPVTGPTYKLNLDKDGEETKPEVVKGPTWRAGSWEEYRNWLTKAYKTQQRTRQTIARLVVKSLRAQRPQTAHSDGRPT